MLQEFDCLGVTSVASPLELTPKLKAVEGEVLPSPEKYMRLIGKLLFLTHTRPGICFGVQHLSQFLHTPRIPHMVAALHLLWYLKGTLEFGLFYSNNLDFSVKDYTDNDWAAFSDTLKSVSAYCIFLGDSLVGWKSKKQLVVSLSSAEAEYRAVRHVVAELVWLSRLLHDLTVPISFLFLSSVITWQLFILRRTRCSMSVQSISKWIVTSSETNWLRGSSSCPMFPSPTNLPMSSLNHYLGSSIIHF
nr:uncharacterized mitochondrial protein AtMg00810-like [Nicotiana tomentosiformis]